MAILLIQHEAQDFERWKGVFDEDPVGRQKHGVTRYWLYRGADEPSYVVISLEFSSTDEARAFLAEPKLREAWDRAGIEPQARVLEEFETHTY
jgi:hypothetical protein